jgi:hypothetical protein
MVNYVFDQTSGKKTMRGRMKTIWARLKEDMSEPSNGARKDGAAGMLSGCGRGMASAFLLPLAGGLSFCEALALGTSNLAERRREAVTRCATPSSCKVFIIYCLLHFYCGSRSLSFSAEYRYKSNLAQLLV